MKHPGTGLNVSIFIAQELMTKHAGHCEELVREADIEDVDAIGVIGGDGTLREVWDI